MSTTLALRFPKDAPRALEHAMTVLTSVAWAFELVGRAPAEQLLVLVPEHDRDRAAAEVRARLGAHAVPVAAIEVLAKAPAAWVGWREASGLLQVGPVWIAPRSTKRPPGLARALVIDAAHAFGSGVHPTTRLMLSRVLELSPMGPVLDVGAGSGVLSLVALELGAPRAVALEIDPASVEAAAKNAAVNGLAARYDVSSRPLASVEARFPVVLANIIARVLVELAPELAAHVAPGGKLVLSGLRPPDLGLVAPVFAALGLSRGAVVEQEGWLRVELDWVG